MIIGSANERKNANISSAQPGLDILSQLWLDSSVYT